MKPILLLPLLILLISGCDPDENYPKAIVSRGNSTLLVNNNVSLAASDWFFSVGDVGNQGNPNNYQSTRISSTARTGLPSPLSGSGLIGVSSSTTSYTLGMGSSSVLKDTASYCYWLARIPPSTLLRVGASLTLKANVRVQNVRGKGVSLVIRGDKGTKTGVLFATTEGLTSIRGTVDATEYSVTLPYTTAVDVLIVYLVMLSNTSGSASFSDVTVDVK